MKMWAPGCSAFSTACTARRMSSSLVRDRLSTMGVETSSATRRTDLKSPSDDAANPASITSTFSFSSCPATMTFSSMFMVAPGDCSPSRSVVSKILTVSRSMTSSSCLSINKKGCGGIRSPR